MEMSFGTMMGNKRPEYPMVKRNIQSFHKFFGRSMKSKRQVSRTATGNILETGVPNNNYGSNTSTNDLLRLCKPLSVYLTRLPDSVVNKYAVVSKKKLPIKRKSQKHKWKNGICYKRQRYLRLKKMRRMKIRLLNMLKSETDDNKNNAVEAVAPDPLSDCENLNKFESVGNSPFKLDEFEIIADKAETMIECNETLGRMTHKITVSEASDYKLAFIDETNGALRSTDHKNDSNLPKERMTQTVSSCNEVHNSPLVATINHPENNYPSTIQQDCNQNSNVSLKSLKEKTGRPISRHTSKKRSISLSESKESNEQRRLSQRFKQSEYAQPSLCSENTKLSNENIISNSNHNVASIQHDQTLPEQSKKSNLRFVRRRRKSSKSSSITEAMVVVKRLDNSHSPLVEKWKNKIGLSDGNDDANSAENLTQESSSTEVILEEKNNEEALDSSTSDNTVERTNALLPMLALNSSPFHEKIKISDDIVMCDSNEDDSEEDDDEIIEFLPTRRNIFSCVENSSSENESDDEEYSRRQSSRISTKVRPVTRSVSRSDLGQTERPFSRRQLESSTLYELSSDSSSDQIELRKIRAFHLEEDTKSLSLRKRRTASWTNYSNSNDELNEEEIITPPLTRSKSRMAMDNLCYENTSNVNEVLKNQSKRESHDRLQVRAYNNSPEMSINKEINAKENETENTYMENIQDFAESHRNEKRDVSLDSMIADYSNFSTIDGLNIQRNNYNENYTARKKLTIMKDAMVVLTRLEDLRNISGDNEFSANENEFKDTDGFSFSPNYCHEKMKNDTDLNDDIDLQSNEAVLYRRSSDVLEIDGSLINESHNYAVILPAVIPNDRDAIIYNSEKTKNDKEKMIDSEYDTTLIVDDKVPQEPRESSTELSLLRDEHDKTSTDTSMGNLAEGILTDANGNSDRPLCTPASTSPDDLDIDCQHSHSEEHQGEKQQLACQNISVTPKCITCNCTFKDSEQLEQHKASNTCCNVAFSCNVCETNFATLLELAKHRSSCSEGELSKRNSVDRLANEKPSPENRLSQAAAVSEMPRSKDKKQKPSGQKNQHKKSRLKPRCQADDLTCNVCSITFATKTALSEHLYKHSSVELQEAFRIAKAKAMMKTQADSAEKQNTNESVNNQANSDAPIDSSNVENLRQNFCTNEEQIIISNTSTIATATVSKEASSSMLATVCSCHKDNDEMPLDNIDLQIEMVLLCKYCQVLFRRRECLEVHYRFSSQCATDRKRERLPRLFCANCQLILKNWSDMRHHLEIHAHENAERAIRFVCNICRVVFVGFGTLFFNHWLSHSKDPMFVAGRYNFPKFSVQLPDGTEKLPVGTKREENYIFVAEHVCTNCKKPFSMRRDMEEHQIHESCSKKNTNFETIKYTDSSRLVCDVCHLTFENKKALNDHGKNKHDNHFTYVAATKSAGHEAFSCTKCSTMMPSVRALEKHWKTHGQHNESPEDSSSTKETTFRAETRNPKLVLIASSDKNHGFENQSLKSPKIGVNSVTLTDKARITEESPVITIEDVDMESDKVSHASVEILANETICTDDQESLIPMSLITQTNTSTPVVTVVNNLPMLRGLLQKSLAVTNTVEKQRAKIRALEDPCVKVMLSDTNSTNASASLIVTDSHKKTKDSTVDSNTDSYQILLSDQSSSKNITMVISKKSPATPASESLELPTTQSFSGEKAKTVPANRSDPKAKKSLVISTVESLESPTTQSVCGEKAKTVPAHCSDPKAQLGSKPTSITTTQTSVLKNMTERCSNQAREDSDKEKKNSCTSKLPKNDQTVAPSDPLTEKQPVVLEIIDIIDDVPEQRGSSSNVNLVINQTSQAHADLISNNKKNSNLQDFRKSRVKDLPNGSASIINDTSKHHTVNENGTSQQNSSGSAKYSKTRLNEKRSPETSKHHSAANKADFEMSFEENRWKWMNSASVNVKTSDSQPTKKQGFLRVKDLSELQAVTTNNNCSTGNTSSEFLKILNDKNRLHMNGGFIHNKDVQYPMGISAALVLPDPSEHPKTPEKTSPTLDKQTDTSAQSSTPEQSVQPSLYVPPQISGIISLQGTETGDQLSSIVVSNDSSQSWLPVVSPQVPVVPQVNTSISSQNVNTNFVTNSQRPMNNPSNSEVANNVSILRTDINQIQNNITTQQQPFVLSSVESLATQKTTPQLPENRNAQVGYHVLPPMVVLPSTQTIPKQQQPIAVTQHASSNNYLPAGRNFTVTPFIYRSEEPNKYLCTICRAFQCDSVEMFNNHITKHYTSWKHATMITQNSLQPSPVAIISATTVPISTPSSLNITDDRPIFPKNISTEANPVENSAVFRNWTVKDTPQGPVLVTPVVNTPNRQLLTSFVHNNNRSILRPSHSNSNNPVANNSLPNNGQIVFRCSICKSALYKTFLSLRNHVILVHGVTDSNLLQIQNIAEKNYHCTQCPSTTALFDCEEKYRQHVDDIHTPSCPSCRRVFSNFITLRNHLEQCRVSSSNDRSTYGNNC